MQASGLTAFFAVLRSCWSDKLNLESRSWFVGNGFNIQGNSFLCSPGLVTGRWG